MGSKLTKEVTEGRSSRNWPSCAKAKIKKLLSGQPSRNETVAESSGNTPSTLPGSSTVNPDANTVNQTLSAPPMPVLGVTSNPKNSTLRDEVADTIENPNIWLKAYKAATPDTRKWIDSLPKLTISQDADDRSWVAEIVKVVEALEEKHQDSSVRITVGQKEIALKDYVAPTVKWLTLIGDISTQFAPAPSGIVWSAIKVLLQVPVTGIGETAAILASTSRVLSILRRGKVYEIVFTEDNTAPELLQDFGDALLALYAKSLDLLAYAARHLKNQYRQILEWISNPGHATSLIAELTQCETELSRTVRCCEVARSANADETHTELLLNLHHSVDQIDDGMRRLFDKMEKKEMIEALDYFSNIKIREHHQRKLEKRIPGTGMWLLAHSKFKEWEHTEESSILWLQGTVGMGKTFLASTVIDQFLVNDAASHAPKRKNNEGFAYFYCERGSNDLREPISVLRSYVRQLSIVPYYPECMQKELIELYWEIRRQGAKLNTEDCKDLIFASANLYPRTILILDGLDECDLNERWTLIDILTGLVTHAKNPVKIFISSRREQSIAKQLELSPIIEVHARDNQDDIRNFVEEKIKKIEKTGKWLSISQDLKNEVKDTVCAKSDGMFRWADLQMDELSKLCEENTLKERLGKLPKPLNAAYEQIFQRIEEDGGRDTLERAVKWVMCAERPLTTCQILDAIRLSASSDGTSLRTNPKIAEETLLDICGHLIVKDSRSEEWKFPHASVIEYFEEVHQWSLDRAHLFVAKICLLYLLDDSNTQKMDEIKASNFDSEEDIWRYILESWPIHVSAIEKSELHEDEISKLLKRFLGIDKSPRQSSQHYQHWVGYAVAYYERDKSFIHRSWTKVYQFEPADNFYPAEDPIFGICIFGFYHLLQDYWGSGIDILPVNKRKMDLLSIAAYYGHLEICEKLIELGSDVNRQRDGPPGESTALQVILRKGNVNMVRYLMSQGADPYLPSNGPSALCTATSSNSRCIETLLDLKVDPNHPCGPQCKLNSALEAAAYMRNIEAAKLLLRNGADANRMSETGYCGSALLAAAFQGSEEICQLLIEHGADVNAPLKVGKYGSALAAAASVGEIMVCDLLIKHGADVNASLSGEYSSALAAAKSGGKFARRVYQLLINHGAEDTSSTSSESNASTSSEDIPHSVPWGARLSHYRPRSL